MAYLNGYKCEECGYEVFANPKGHGLLMLGEIFCFACKNCRHIVNVNVAYDEMPKKFICPDCGSENLEKWNPITGKCPKCNGVFRKTGTVLLED